MVVVAGWWWFGHSTIKDAGKGGPPVSVSAPKKQTLTEWDEYTGRFQAVDRIEIRARVSGYLDAIRFADGQTVKKGDVLFVIDQRPFEIALERAESLHDLARKEYERSKTLRSSSAGSQQDLDRRFQQFREATAALDEAKLNMEFTEVKSPINGRVSRHLVDRGNLISGGDVGATLLTTVVSRNPIYFYFEASEQELLKYIRLDKDGKRESSRTQARPVYVKLQDEKDYIHQGVMDFVDNEIDRSSGSIQGRAVFENNDDTLLPGFFGRLRIAGSGEYEAMLIPDEAVASNQSQKIVYTVNADHAIEPRPVVLGPLYEGKWRIVRSGLSDSDQIVWSGLAKIRPGMQVTPMPPSGDVSSSEKKEMAPVKAAATEDNAE